MEIKRIDSSANPLIKEWVRWQSKANDRRKAGVVVVEGLREVERALRSGWVPRHVAVRAGSSPSSQTLQQQWGISGRVLVELGGPAWEKLAIRDGVDNVLAVFEAPQATLAQLPTPQRGLVLVAVETEKPGNLGALLRTADAVGVDAVLVVDPVCDPWNPQVARNSLGGLFHVPLAVCSSSEARTWIKEQGLTLVLGHLEATQEHTQASLSGPVAVVVGPEDRGLSPDWDQKEALRVKIPMRGLVDSLNVSVSAAVLLYEVDRQQQASKV